MTRDRLHSLQNDRNFSGVAITFFLKELESKQIFYLSFDIRGSQVIIKFVIHFGKL